MEGILPENLKMLDSEIEKSGGGHPNNSVDMKGDRKIWKGLCGDQPALTLPGMGNSLTALAIRLGMSPAGVGYAAQRGEAIAHENGYQLTQ